MSFIQIEVVFFIVSIIYQFYYSYYRQLYWTAWHKDFSDSGKVYQTSMDGSVNTVLFDSDTGLIQPNGLALDYAQNNLYIVDVIKDTIARSTLNTNDYEVIQRLTSAQGNGELTALEQDLPASYHASSMDFFNNELYFGDILRPPRLSKVNVNAPSGSTELVSNLRREPGSIRVVDISRQPDEADSKFLCIHTYIRPRADWQIWPRGGLCVYTGVHGGVANKGEGCYSMKPWMIVVQ